MSLNNLVIAHMEMEIMRILPLSSKYKEMKSTLEYPENDLLDKSHCPTTFKSPKWK